MAGMVEKLKKYPYFIKALLLSLFPLVSGVLLCLWDGKTIGDVYLPASVWNDELFYYKQVEAVLHYGFPQGFFGYNESMAQYLSFGAWNPVVLLPYVLWGLLFGWNLMSPILCHIVLSTVAVFVFVFLTKPTAKQGIALGILYLASLFTGRYMLSGMTETLCIFYGILYLAFCISYREKEKNWKLIGAVIVIGILTMLRPYFLIFILLPLYFAFRKYGWRVLIAGVLLIGGIGATYYVITANFCADYYIGLSQKILPEGPYSLQWQLFFKNILVLLFEEGRGFLHSVLADLKGGVNAVGLAGQFAVIWVLFLIQAFVEKKQKKKETALIYGGFAASLIVILISFFLLYNMQVGSRHLVVFITMGIFCVSRMEDKYFVRTGIVAASLLFLFFRVPEESEQRKLYYKESDIEQELSAWEEVFDSQMVLNREATPNWDNVVIWAMSDVVEGEEHLEYAVTKWQMFYALPKGMGISCCMQDYVLQNFENLRGRYLAVAPGGNIERMCREAGKKELGRGENLVIFELHEVQ